MKKVFTSLFLLMLGVMATYATNYGLSVAGVNVTSTGSVSAGQSEGTINWDGSTLTFTDVTLSSSSSVVYYTGTSAITVKFIGNNTLTSTSETVFFSYHADMTLRGRFNTGDRATIKYTGSVDGRVGVYVRDGKNLKIIDLYLTVSGRNAGLVAETGDSYASKLSVTTAVIDISTTSSGTAAVRGFSSASFDSSDAYLTDGRYYDTTNKRVVNSDGTIATVVRTDAPLFVGGAIVGIGYTSELAITPAGVTEGTIKYNDNNKTLTFNAVKMTTEVAGDLMNVVWNKNLDGLNIQFNGMNTLALSSNSSGSVIKTEKKLTIKGEGVDITKLTTLSGRIGIYGPNGEVIIDNASVFANGIYGVIGTSGKTLNLTVKNAWLAAKGTEGSIQNVENCVLDGVQSATDIASGVCYRKALKGFGTATEIYKDVIWILPWSEDYNVSVLGTKVTDLNRDGIAVDGLTAGTMVFDKDSKTLTLDGVTMTGPEEGSSEVYGISGSGLSKIVFSGTNQITNDGTCFYLTSSVTMEGTGSIIATSNKHSGIYNGVGLNISMNSKAKFFGLFNGIWGNDGNLTLTKAGIYSDYYFRCTSTNDVPGAIRAKSLTLNNMDFWSGSDGTPGCYFDNGYVRQNGGEEVKGEDKVVNFYYLSDGDSYGILVGGVEVTRCNMQGIGSKYITAGGGKAVTYSNSSKTLTLNGAKIDMSSAAGGDCCIWNSKDVSFVTGPGVDNLIINVTGNNELRSYSSGWSSLNLWRNTTIQGSGNLKLSGDGGDIHVTRGSLVTLNDVNIEAAGVIEGDNDGNLHVNLTTAGKKISVAGGVCNWASISLDNGTKIGQPVGATISGGNVVVGGSLATNVVFVDASATGIEGVIMNADAEVTDVFDAEGRQLNEMQHGVNIVRMSDGTTRKVIKK